MSKNNVTVGGKIAGGFGIVLFVLIGVVCFTYLGIGNILEDAQKVIYGNQLMGDLVQREIDHLSWAGKVNAFLTADSAAILDVETDHKKCRLGTWLNAEDGRKKAERRIPSLASLFKELEKAHEVLHQSAIKIKEVYRPADAKLPAKLVRFEVDLLQWIAQIQDALANKQRSLAVITDPAESELGKCG